jgi:uncharacterized membrane protein
MKVEVLVMSLSETGSEAIAPKWNRWQWQQRGLLLGIILLGVLLAFHDLGVKSWWLDEIIESQIASMRLSEIVIAAPTFQGKLPLHYILGHAAFALGVKEFTSRLPSAFAAVLAIPVIYVTGNRFFGEQTGILSSFLLAISPFHVRYAQEARPYALWMLLSLLFLPLTHVALHKNDMRSWALLGLTALLAFYTDFITIALALAVAITICCLAVGRNPLVNSKTIRRFALVGVAWLILLLPLPGLLRAYNSNFQVTTAVTGILLNPARLLDLVPGYVHFLATYIPGTVAEYSAGAPWLYLPVFLAGVIASWRRQAFELLLLTVWIIVPSLLLSLLFMLTLGYMTPRYLIYILPACLLVTARGITGIVQASKEVAKRLRATDQAEAAKGVHAVASQRQERIVSRASLAVCVSIFSVASISPLSFYYQHDKQAGKEVARYLTEAGLPGDTIILAQASWEETTQYLKLGRIPYPGETLPMLRELCREPDRRVWYVRTNGLYLDDAEVFPWVQLNMEKVRSFSTLDSPEAMQIYRCGPSSRAALEQEIQRLQEVLAASPNDGTALFSLANALSTLGHWAEAIPPYERALKSVAGSKTPGVSQTPGVCPILREMGRAQMGLGYWKEAINAFGQALELDPLAPGIAHDMAEAYRQYLALHGEGGLALGDNLVKELNQPQWEKSAARSFLDAAISHSGKPGMAMQGLTRGSHGGWWGEYTLESNLPYLYSAYVKTQDQGFIIGPLKTSLLHWENADNSLRGGQSGEGSMDWTYLSTVLYLPSHDVLTQTVRIVPGWMSGQGLVWIDDVRLARLPTSLP